MICPVCQEDTIRVKCHDEQQGVEHMMGWITIVDDWEQTCDCNPDSIELVVENADTSICDDSSYPEYEERQRGRSWDEVADEVDGFLDGLRAALSVQGVDRGSEKAE